MVFFPEKINFFRENKNKSNFSWKIVFFFMENEDNLEIQSAETGENINIR